MRQLAETDLLDLATGAALLGTGGGGSPYVGRLLAAQAIRATGPVDVVDLEELRDDALVVLAAMMGAPTVMAEKLPSGHEIGSALDALQDRLGRTITHLVPAEIGGINSMIPCAAAAARRLPLVDADAMGRAFPEVQMVTPTIYGIPAAPLALADEKGNVVVLETVDNLWMERLARAVTVQMGSTSLIASYAMSGADARRCLVPRTLTLAHELGALVRAARAAGDDVANAVAQRLCGDRLFDGKVTDVERRTEGGFARGTASIEGIGADAGSMLELTFQNEHLLAARDGVVVTTVPDLIIVVDTETGAAITTEDLRYGSRVTVLAARCDAQWRTDAGLGVAGPRCFGLDMDFVPAGSYPATTAGD